MLNKCYWQECSTIDSLQVNLLEFYKSLKTCYDTKCKTLIESKSIFSQDIPSTWNDLVQCYETG
jgi:hypothetical protein